MSLKFDAQSPLGEALRDFYKMLTENRGARAELRRCKSVEEVAMSAVFQRFRHSRLASLMQGEYEWETRMAAIMGLVAHLSFNETGAVLASGDERVEAFARQMTRSKKEPPIVNELRFRRLLQRERYELYITLIRVLRMLEGKANLYGLAESVFYWGDGIKKRWAFAYFPNVPDKQSA